MTKDKLKKEILENFRAEGGFDNIPLNKACEFFGDTIDYVYQAGRREGVLRALEEGIDFLNNYPLKGFSNYDDLYEKLSDTFFALLKDKKKV